MGAISYYTAMFIPPLAMLILVIASLLAHTSTKRRSALAMAIGFTMVLGGFILQNLPKDITYSESGDAIFYTTDAFAVGSLVGPFGLLAAAVSFLFFCRGMQ